MEYPTNLGFNMTWINMLTQEIQSGKETDDNLRKGVLLNWKPGPAGFV